MIDCKFRVHLTPHLHQPSGPPVARCQESLRSLRIVGGTAESELEHFFAIQELPVLSTSHSDCAGSLCGSGGSLEDAQVDSTALPRCMEIVCDGGILSVFLVPMVTFYPVGSSKTRKMMCRDDQCFGASVGIVVSCRQCWGEGCLFECCTERLNDKQNNNGKTSCIRQLLV